MWRIIPNEASDVGRRLDLVLADRLGLSRGGARRLLDAGAVRVNGRTVDAAAKGRLVEAGDGIAVLDEAMEALPRPTPEAPLSIVSAGEGWLIVDKPADTAVHPLRPGETGTVLNAVVARHPQIVGVGEAGLRSGVVHRLDVDTTGCLLFATAQPTWQRLRQAFADRRVRKMYHALVRGRLEGRGDEAMHLAVTRHRPARVGVVEAASPGSRRCTLAWRSLAASDAGSLIEVDLGSGFLHQIRAMFSHLGHPLIGDDAYGGPATAVRPMLHAWSLHVDEVGGQVDPPADFAAMVRQLGL